MRLPSPSAARNAPSTGNGGGKSEQEYLIQQMGPGGQGGRAMHRPGDGRRTGEMPVEGIDLDRRERLEDTVQQESADGRNRRADERALTGVAPGALGVLIPRASSVAMPARIATMMVWSKVIVRSGRYQGERCAAGRLIGMRMMPAAPEHHVREHAEHRQCVNQSPHRRLPSQEAYIFHPIGRILLVHPSSDGEIPSAPWPRGGARRTGALVYQLHSRFRLSPWKNR